MLPIFDPKGATIAWLRDDLFFDLGGKVTAFLKGENIVNFSGQHCGYLIDNFFRDHKGDIVAFLREAQGGPKLPFIKMLPPIPIAGFVPMKPFVPIAPLRPRLTLNWSDLSWENFLAPAKLSPKPQPPQAPKPPQAPQTPQTPPPPPAR